MSSLDVQPPLSSEMNMVLHRASTVRIESGRTFFAGHYLINSYHNTNSVEFDTSFRTLKSKFLEFIDFLNSRFYIFSRNFSDFYK